MRNQLIGLILGFLFLQIAFLGGSMFYYSSIYSDSNIRNQNGQITVNQNEIAHLISDIKSNPNSENLENLENTIYLLNENSIYSPLPEIKNIIVYFFTSSVIFLFLIFLLIYLRVIRPFNQLENFAKNIASGNFDLPLPIHRKNIFGAFSWAFDSMRSELKIAKENDEESRQAKKTLIATISHDIKTPVASIRAYAEALQNGMDTTAERRKKYLNVIMKKADEVSELTNDLFLHALSDLEKLETEIEEVSSKELINEILEPYLAQYNSKLQVINSILDKKIKTDRKRLAQVFENIITNSSKYAPNSNIEISFSIEDEYLSCTFRDYGTGIPPEDIPFIFNKFYRGKNIDSVNGSGLGLYIVKYILDRTDGKVTLNSNTTGLEVKIFLHLAE